MNDFTKEELECLHNAISLQLRDVRMSETNARRRNELVDKIQFMIDNYCEHDNVKSLSDADYVYRCSDCDKIVGYK
ncbi:TPA: hypothetical protein RJD83_000249 [Legionella pneumophila]|nr:hypothetical protein [Legionella pneumophila]